MRNFSSMSAIVTALQSAVVERLTVTKRELKRLELSLLKRLDEVLQADHHFQAYRNALESSSKPCVPWFGTSTQL